MSGPTHNNRIFFASFMTLIAAGMGFAIRGGILGDWQTQFGFTKSEIGTITGFGLAPFGFTIICFSLFADKVGYKPLLAGAFALHLISALFTLSATAVFTSSGKDATFWCLAIGMFLFSLANGLCEAVINPLVATLYPKQKTHYLNILHAGWPGGLILGGLLAYCFTGSEALVTKLRWEIPMAFFLVPTLWYGIIAVSEKFPLSEARAAGVNFVQMIKEFAAPLLLFLLVLHAMVGYVELGTDNWITNIMNNVIAGNALLLFVWTSGIMFVLRFFAGPIVERINPLGLLFVSACLGATGLFLLGSSTTGIAIFLAATVYGVGKTFLWPTMLGVVGERFPRGGAVTMGTMGGIGMLSAGLLGAPGIGYTQDFFASKDLKQSAPQVFEQVVSPNKNSFLFFPTISGLDGAKVAKIEDDKDNPDYAVVKEASIFGGRMALKVTAAIPLTMAIGYLLLIIYFRAIGGYKAVEIDNAGHEHEGRYTPSAEDAIEVGLQGPGQA